MPVETDGKQPEPKDPEPLQAVVAQDLSPNKNGSNQPQTIGVGVKTESGNSVLKESHDSPPPPGKYTC